MKYFEIYYREILSRQSNEELIEEIMRLKKELNTREAIKADSQWISQYDSLNKNLYLLNNDLVKDNQFLKEENIRLENIIEELVKEEK